jgi:nucleotide-binding universal stress UspA family protein
MMGKILAAVDGSKPSEVAFLRAIVLAKAGHSELHIVHVIPETRSGGFTEYGTGYGSMAIVHSYYAAMRKGAQEWITPLEHAVEAEGVRAKSEILWELGKPAAQLITEYAKKNDIDLIVMGTRGLGGFKRLLLGSVASAVVTHAHCSVMIVR